MKNKNNVYTFYHYDKHTDSLFCTHKANVTFYYENKIADIGFIKKDLEYLGCISEISEDTDADSIITYDNILVNGILNFVSNDLIINGYAGYDIDVELLLAISEAVKNKYENNTKAGYNLSIKNASGIKFSSDSSTIANELKLINIEKDNIEISWDQYFMAIANLVRCRSKDPVTKVGACLVLNNKIISTGYNGFPRNISNEKYPWTKGSEDETGNKFFYVVHAELNAILNSPTSVMNVLKLSFKLVLKRLSIQIKMILYFQKRSIIIQSNCLLMLV